MSWAFREFVAKRFGKIRKTQQDHTEYLEAIALRLDGYVPPMLVRAITRLAAVTKSLDAEIKAHGSNSGEPTWQAKTKVTNEGKLSMSGSQILDKLVEEVEEATTVVASATVFIQGIKAELEAIKAELANSVSEAQLQRLSDLITGFNTEEDKLKAAMVANTPTEE